MKRSIRTFLILFAALAIVATAAYAAPAPVVLKFVETTDVHGSLFPYNFITDKPVDGSLAQLAYYLMSERADPKQSVVLLDDGDILQGQPVVYYYNFEKTSVPHVVSQVMNYLRLRRGYARQPRHRGRPPRVRPAGEGVRVPLARRQRREARREAVLQALHRSQPGRGQDRDHRHDHAVDPQLAAVAVLDGHAVRGHGRLREEVDQGGAGGGERRHRGRPVPLRRRLHLRRGERGHPEQRERRRAGGHARRRAST